tara:strand:+ start:7182 stop:7715 length:534 start_codon:yes stop_codon:yes gene_type:complete
MNIKPEKEKLLNSMEKYTPLNILRPKRREKHKTVGYLFITLGIFVMVGFNAVFWGLEYYYEFFSNSSMSFNHISLIFWGGFIFGLGLVIAGGNVLDDYSSLNTDQRNDLIKILNKHPKICSVVSAWNISENDLCKHDLYIIEKWNRQFEDIKEAKQKVKNKEDINKELRKKLGLAIN